jgi:hypothetical protein
MILTGENQTTWLRTIPTAILSTTNHTLNGPGSNPVLRCDKPAANRQSHGTTFKD